MNNISKSVPERTKSENRLKAIANKILKDCESEGLSNEEVRRLSSLIRIIATDNSRRSKFTVAS